MNHSVNSSTTDQVRQNNTISEININIVKEIWREVKDRLTPKYRTKKSAQKRYWSTCGDGTTRNINGKLYNVHLKLSAFRLLMRNLILYEQERLITEERMEESEEEEIGNTVKKKPLIV